MCPITGRPFTITDISVVLLQEINSTISNAHLSLLPGLCGMKEQRDGETESLEQTFDRRQQKSSGVINDLVKAGVTPAQGSAG